RSVGRAFRWLRDPVRGRPPRAASARVPRHAQHGSRRSPRDRGRIRAAAGVHAVIEFFEDPDAGSEHPGTMLAPKAMAVSDVPAARVVDGGRAYEHAGRVRAFLLRIGVAAADAEDLTAETFLIAHEERDRFDASREVLPWLFGIAAVLARRYRRRRWALRLF